jgi:hypothetical protein
VIHTIDKVATEAGGGEPVEPALDAFAITFPGTSRQHDQRRNQIHHLPHGKYETCRRARSTVFCALVAAISRFGPPDLSGPPVWLKRSVVIAHTRTCRPVTCAHSLSSRTRFHDHIRD